MVDKSDGLVVDDVVVDPPAAIDPVIDPPVADPVVDPVVDPNAPPPSPHGNKGKQPWFLDRISQESAKRAQAEEELKAERTKRQETEAALARAQAGEQPNATPQRGIAPDSPEFHAAVEQRAAAQKLFEDSTSIKNAGIAAYGNEFNNSLRMLGALGATNDDFVTDVISVDKVNAHILLNELANDPERTAALVSMNPRARIAELTRLSMTTAPKVEPKVEPLKPAADTKKVSRAPAPPPPVEPSASKVVDWRADTASDEEFDKGFNEMRAKRSARR